MCRADRFNCNRQARIQPPCLLPWHEAGSVLAHERALRYLPPAEVDGMHVRLVKEYRFEAAHRLSCVPAHHPCGRLHGHSYRVELSLEGPVDPQAGWLIDFGEIDAAWQPVKEQLDHGVLNELPGLDNPTSENLTKWLWDQLVEQLPMLRRVSLWETADARCEYEGPSGTQ